MTSQEPATGYDPLLGVLGIQAHHGLSLFTYEIANETKNAGAIKEFLGRERTKQLKIQNKGRMSGDFGKENKSGQVERKLKLSGDRMHGMIDKSNGHFGKFSKVGIGPNPHAHLPTHACE
jgi:hypothetical protein